MIADNIIIEWVIRQYENGWNPIPWNTKEDKPVLDEYIPYRETPPRRAEIEDWMPLFEKYGVAQITGRCHRGKFKGLYLNCVDFDSPQALDKLLEMYSLEQLAKEGIFVEQHYDNKGKAHLWILSTKPFPKLSSTYGNGVEVKSDGLLCNSFPSFNKGGYRYFPVGDSLKIFDDDVEPMTNDGFVKVIDKISGGKYLDGKANGDNYNTIFRNKAPIRKGERHSKLLGYANSLIARLYKTTNRETIYHYLVVYNNNPKEVEEPLPELELKQIFNDAWNNIGKSVSVNVQNPNQNRAEEGEAITVKVTKEDIDSVIETMTKEAKHDGISIKQLFYGKFTGFTKVPMNHIVNSKSAGAGKSYLLILVAKYFPKRYVLVLMGASDKSLHHKQGTMVLEDLDTGELTEVEPIINRIRIEILAFKEQFEAEKSKQKDKRDNNLIKNLQKQISEKEEEITSILERQAKLVSLNDTIILFLDTPQDGFFDALMSVLSNDTDTYQKYVFTDKSASGKLVSRTNIFRGTPVMFATRVVDDTANKRFEERNRRFINVTPNVSPQKIEDANALILKGAGLTPEEYDESVVSRQDKEKSRMIVSAIVEKLRNHSKYLGPKEYGVKIPFIDSIKIPNQIEWSMTVMRRLVGYLAIVTKVRMDSRPRLVRRDNSNIFLPISTFEDLKEALELMERGASSIRPYLADWYNEVFLPTFNAEDKIKEEQRDGTTLKENYISVSSSHLREKHKELKGIPISSDDLRHKYIDPLINHGLIEKTKSEIRKSENIYFPVDEKGDNIFSLFSQDLKLPVKASHYPTKDVIVSTISRLFENQAQKKYREDGGGVFEENISIYRLVDPEGQEITPEQLADRYFSDPDKCFTKEF